jgi:hypothetical protein
MLVFRLVLIIVSLFQISKMKKTTFLALSLVTLLAAVQAQKKNVPAGLSSIKSTDLKNDLYALADAHFNGRSAGTLDELKASTYIGEVYKKIGLLPLGDDGTYFQFFNLMRNVLDEQSTIQINGKEMKIWKEVSVQQMANYEGSGIILYAGNAVDIDTSKIDVKGKIVAFEANSKGINLDVSLPTWRYSRSIMTKYAMPLIRKGAAAIIIVADEVGEKSFEDANANFQRGTYDIEGGPNERLQFKVPVIWVHAAAKQMIANNASVSMKLNIQHYAYPSVNIIGKIEGTDPTLKNEYVLYSGHQDAHGIRNVQEGDSIYYGADDNASVDVAMFAIARAFKAHPSKRSILFVIHGAEERGLLGSRYYSAHPTVDINQVVTVLNGDMIGRNHIDSAAILGAQAPHKNSSDLVNIALQANLNGPQFKLDTNYDKITHVEGWYFRSDHLPYARLGIPALMYTTLLHPDYHTPKDNAQNINYPKLKKMTDWMYLTGWEVGNRKERPAKEANFKLER